MPWFLSWYLLISLLGWLAFPIAWRLFPALPSRAYAFTRTIGLLLWGYIFWLCTSLGISQNDVSGLLFGLLLLALLTFWVANRQPQRNTDKHECANHPSEILLWLKSNLRLVVNVELLFLLSFAFLAFVRASNPELTSAEKPMELMFINSILRSPTFPPRDGWLSGYAISYYHFGYIMTAMLAKLTGTPGSAAHNLMTALIFGLSAVGAYGLLYDLLARQQPQNKNHLSPTDYALRITDYASRLTSHAFLAPLFLLLVSNLEGFLELLHRRGLFWKFSADGSATSAFWAWLDVRDLNQPPLQPLGWVPDRYLWWWRASRIVQDYDLSGGFNEIIDEFPFFSFLHADLHPHVLAIPFGLLAMGIALHIFYGGWLTQTNLFGFSLRLSKSGLLFTTLTLGGLAFLNTWDILVAAALVVGAYTLVRVAEAGWGWERGEEALTLALPLGILAVVLYLPFYLGFSSQLGGILPNLVYPTRGAHLWVMFGTLWLPLFAYLIFVGRVEKLAANWRLALGLSLGLALLLWGLSWLLGWVISLASPETGALFLQQQNMPNLAALFQAATQKRLVSLGGLLTLLALLTPALAFLLEKQQNGNPLNLKDEPPAHALPAPSPVTFTLLLVVLGTLLVIGPEFLYLRDLFGTRINTIFKFYYQAWIVWSIAAAFGVVTLSKALRGVWAGAFYVALSALLAVGITYPLYSLPNRTGNFRLGQAWPLLHEIRISESASLRQEAWQRLNDLWTLDYFDYVERSNPDAATALRWLQTAPDGVVAEAIGGSYSSYGRVSAYTGLPTVLGWPFHEYQWRGTFSLQGAREADIKTLYATPDWQVARDILEQYHIRYVYIGDLERAEPLQEEKFSRYLRLAFQSGNVTIYEVP
ncbi:MAG: DUF2298 domain-containing protein [Anaerolineales bacterium]